MAQVFERGDIYYARFRHRGRDYCRSTGIAVPGRRASREARTAALDRAQARMEAMLAEVRGHESIEELFARLVDALGRLPEPDRGQKKVTLAERLRDDLTASLKVSEAWEAWVNSPRRKRRAGAATLDSYHAYWGKGDVKRQGTRNRRAFTHWLAATHPQVEHLHDITEAMAAEYAAFLAAQGVSEGTYNKYIGFLRGMFEVLRKPAGLARNVWDGIAPQEENPQGRRMLTEEELKKVCRQAEGEIRYMVALGIYTGLRLGDVVTFRWEYIDWEKHSFSLVPSKTGRGRRGASKRVSFALHPVLEALLLELRGSARKPNGYLFPELAAQYAKGNRNVATKRIQAFFEGCGIATHRPGTGKWRDEEGRVVDSGTRAVVEVGFHSLRHTFVSLCKANNVPQAAIQELVGHSSPAMTALYTHAGDELKAKAIAALPAMAFAAETDGKRG